MLGPSILTRKGEGGVDCRLQRGIVDPRGGHLAPESRVNGMWRRSMQYTLAADGGTLSSAHCAIAHFTLYIAHCVFQTMRLTHWRLMGTHRAH